LDQVDTEAEEEPTEEPDSAVPESEPLAGSEIAPEPESEPANEAEPEPSTEPELDSSAESEPTAEPESVADPEPMPDSESEASAESTPDESEVVADEHEAIEAQSEAASVEPELAEPETVVAPELVPEFASVAPAEGEAAVPDLAMVPSAAKTKPLKPVKTKTPKIKPPKPQPAPNQPRDKVAILRGVAFILGGLLVFVLASLVQGLAGSSIVKWSQSHPPMTTVMGVLVNLTFWPGWVISVVLVAVGIVVAIASKPKPTAV